MTREKRIPKILKAKENGCFYDYEHEYFEDLENMGYNEDD